MTEREIREIFINQMCADFNCTREQFCSRENVFTERADNPGRRKFFTVDSPVKVLCTGGKIVLSARPDFYDECREAFKNVNGAWFSNFRHMSKMNEILQKKGYRVFEFHHYYLPLGTEAVSKEQMKTFSDGLKFEHFDRESVERFRGDERFMRALSFLEDAPDVCAITASDREGILGMSGASADSDTMWQIGIDVCANVRGRNLGALLTIMLKNEILEGGHLPYYGTAESHIQSQKVAVKSGFAPFWAEMVSAPAEKSSIYS